MDQFVVSALKYRPRLFDEVVGQEHVTKTLKNAIKADRMAHAFLFCGPRGVGKTSCARILARTINCENLTQDTEACGICENCKNFDNQASMNIIELDAASNNSVENIRTLIEQVRYYPQSGKYKVFIIDEVHMLSQSAFNAFLKTLEEPPEHVIFILATTEKNKILPTILSRCQVFDFKRISDAGMIQQLSSIAEENKITYDEDALRIIAQKADGALRDALSIFDRVVSMSEGKLTYEVVAEHLNVLDFKYYLSITEAFTKGDTAEVLRVFDDIIQRGFDAHEFIIGLSTHFRNLLFCKMPKVSHLMELSESIRNLYESQAQGCSSSFLMNGMHLSNECELEYRNSNNKRLHVELCLMRITSILKKKLAIEPSKPKQESSKKKDLHKPSEPLREISPEKDNFQRLSTLVEDMNDSTSQDQDIEDKKSNETNVQSPSDSNKPESIELGLKSLSSLEAFESEIGELQTEEIGELRIEEVEKHWNEYRKSDASPQLKVMMNDSSISLEGEVLEIIIPSELAKARIQEEKRLMNTMQELITGTNFKLQFKIIEKKIDPENMPERLPVTDGEKMEYFKNKNPVFEDFVNQLSLKIKH